MRQGGVAILLFMIILLLLGIDLLSSLPAAKPVRDSRTLDALREARDALVGRSVQDANRPGSLPCPDTNNDGVADLFHGSDCPSYIGRLPWKTLDLPDLRDASGERFWYVLSPLFRDHPSAEPINSDTKGTLAVYAPDGTTLLTSNAVAVIFSPGSALGNQIRDNVAAACASTGTVIARNLCANNYLDQLNCPGSNCKNNASASGPFVSGPIIDSNGLTVIDDNLIAIRARDIFPAVEKRVAKALAAWLRLYYPANGNHYPHPSKYDACSGFACLGDDTVCRGRFPAGAAPSDVPFEDELALPSWFVKNQWYTEIYYSAGAGSLISPGSLSSPVCNDRLTVSGIQVDAVFFTPGTPIGAIVRPSNNLSDYLEDAENRDGWGSGANDIYVIPTSGLNDRDRITALP